VDVDIRRKVSPWHDLGALAILWFAFLRQRFDVVHSLTPKGGLLGMLAAQVAGVEHRLHTFTGQVWATRQGWSRSGLRLIDRLIASLATMVLTDSRSQNRFLEEEGVVSRGKALVVGAGSICGVDPIRFFPNPELRAKVRRRMHVADSEIVFLFLGRITRDKGIFDLVDAFRRAATQLPFVRLWIAGPDEEGLSEAILERAGDHANRIAIRGEVVVPEEYFAGADVFVLPSYREGFGMAVLEAASAGLPAIASRIYGLTDAVEDGISGVLFPVGNVVALTESMVSMATHADLREQMGRNARIRAARDFSAEGVTHAWCDLYAELLS
jgi:glycosyltransferase involved in cell wall biosynthesis